MRLLVFQCSSAHRDLHSFPTRRSSDLGRRAAIVSTAPTGTFSNSYVTTSLFAASSSSAPASPNGPRIHTPVVAAGHSSDRKSTRLNSSHLGISYAVFCLKKKKKDTRTN